jgi:hypothetical protein
MNRIGAIQKAQTGPDTKAAPLQSKDRKSDRMLRILYSFWCIITWPVHRLVDKTRRYSDLIMALATVVIAAFTIVLARTSNFQAKIMREQGAPEVSIGRLDGLAMEFIGPEDRVTPETVPVYFHTAGHGPALRFWVNLFVVPPSDVPNIVQINANDPHQISNGHLQRWRNVATNEIHEFGGGPTLPEGATTTIFLPKTKGLLQDDLEAVKKGNKFFRVEGTAEYCDSSGNYTCETFSAIYQGSPNPATRLGRVRGRRNKASRQ